MSWNLRIDHNPGVLRCRCGSSKVDVVLGGSIPENRPDGHFYSPTVSQPRLGIIQDEVFGTVCVKRRRELTPELPHSRFKQSGFGRK